MLRTITIVLIFSLCYHITVSANIRQRMTTPKSITIHRSHASGLAKSYLHNLRNKRKAPGVNHDMFGHHSTLLNTTALSESILSRPSALPNPKNFLNFFNKKFGEHHASYNKLVEDEVKNQRVIWLTVPGWDTVANTSSKLGSSLYSKLLVPVDLTLEGMLALRKKLDNLPGTLSELTKMPQMRIGFVHPLPPPPPAKKPIKKPDCPTPLVEEYKPLVEEYKPSVEEYKPPVEEYKPPNKPAPINIPATYPEVEGVESTYQLPTVTETEAPYFSKIDFPLSSLNDNQR